MLLWPVNLVRHFLSPVGWTPYVVNTAVLRTQTSFQSGGGGETLVMKERQVNTLHRYLNVQQLGPFVSFGLQGRLKTEILEV